MCTYPTFVTFRFVCVVSSPDKLSRPSVVYSDACFNCSAKQLMVKVDFRGGTEMSCCSRVFQ